MMRFLKFIKCLKSVSKSESSVQANKCSIYNSCCQTVVEVQNDNGKHATYKTYFDLLSQNCVIAFII